MFVEFTQKQLVAKVREIVSLRPGVKYKPDEVRDPDNPGHVSCLYGKGTCSDGSEGCIFGQALVALGVDRGSLDDGEILGEISEVLDSLDIADNNGMDEWCMVVQKRQDEGKSWGEAVAIADEKFPLAQ